MSIIWQECRLHSISEVVREGLCVSCGACLLTGDTEDITWIFAKKRGLSVPFVNRPGGIIDTGEAFQICPGKGVEIMRIAETIRSPLAEYDVQLGYVLDACAVRTTDERFRERAASGGIVTAIAHHLLSTKRVTGVLSTRFNYGPNGPTPQAMIVRDFRELVECQGSKYCPVDIHEALESLRGHNEKIAFIGTPCHIAALRMMMERFSWLRESIYIVIGSFCGGVKDGRALTAIIRRQGINPSEVTHFCFRGGGQPGRMLIVDSCGHVRTRPYPDYGTDTGFKKLDRCRLCIDGTAELADITCGDAWVSRFMGSGKAWSVAITRNEAGGAILQEMLDNGLIDRAEINLDEIKHSQHSNLTSKKMRQTTRRQLYRILGRRLPSYDGGIPELSTSLLLEFWVHLSYIFLSFLEKMNIYWPFINIVRWVRRTNKYSSHESGKRT